MITTKEQEREALQQIRAIVDGLGEGSYLAAAFDGCFFLAEDNIDNDLTSSFPQRIVALQADMMAMNDDNQKLLEKNRALEAELKEANSRTCLPREDLKKINLMLDSQISSCEAHVSDLADTIVETADQPQSTLFKEAVREHRSCKRDAEDMKKIQKRVAKIITGE